MTEETPSKEQDKRIYQLEPCQNAIRIGDLQIEDYRLSSQDLANLAVALLENQAVKKYLKIFEQQKKNKALGYIE